MSLFEKFGIIKLLLKHPSYTLSLILKKLRFIKRYKWIIANPDKDDKVPPPLAYEFVLTLKCNLRCKMCMLWGDTGWCKTDDKSSSLYQELDLDVIKKVFNVGKQFHPTFILNGGEPLMHSRFREIAQLLKKNKYPAIICTNGTLLDKHKDVIEGNNYLDLLISLDSLLAPYRRTKGNLCY